MKLLFVSTGDQRCRHSSCSKSPQIDPQAITWHAIFRADTDPTPNHQPCAHVRHYTRRQDEHGDTHSLTYTLFLTHTHTLCEVLSSWRRGPAALRCMYKVYAFDGEMIHTHDTVLCLPGCPRDAACVCGWWYRCGDTTHTCSDRAAVSHSFAAVTVSGWRVGRRE